MFCVGRGVYACFAWAAGCLPERDRKRTAAPMLLRACALERVCVPECMQAGVRRCALLLLSAWKRRMEMELEI